MIRFENVVKQFGQNSLALSGIDLVIDKNEYVFLVGPSGSGKTTFLRLLIRDLVPTQGRIIVADWDLTKLPSHKIPHLRKKIGVVFQDLKLLVDRTIYENIALPLEIAGVNEKEIEKKVHELLELVGLSGYAKRFPKELSGGELQRIALARALVTDPEILLADEPTGNLDMGTTWSIMKILDDIHKRGTTIIMATHNTDVIESLKKRTITLESGKLVKDEKPA